MTTWAEFLALPEDDRELIDGQLIATDRVTGRIIRKHDGIIGFLYGRLWGWTRGRGGRVLAPEYKIRISDSFGVIPDIQYYRPGNLLPPWKERPQGTECPDLVVEVTSPPSAVIDRTIKFRGYLSLGVPEYWIVDPERRLIEVWRNNRKYVELRTYDLEATAGDLVFRPASFQGLEIPLADLWSLP